MGDISRRGFLKEVGIVGAVGAAAAIGLAGCSSDDPDQTNGASADVGKRAYSVHESDVVIIGSGIAGLYAAWHALQKGATVAIVDKGRYGHSGNSGMNWGNMFGALEVVGDHDTFMQYRVTDFTSGDGLIDQDLAHGIEEAWWECKPSIMAEQLGCILERGADGNPTQLGSSAAGFMPRVFAQKVKRMGAAVSDRMMAYSLLFTADKSHVAGVVAMDLKDGSAHVFRAKAVVMAAGSYVWASGWSGIRPHTHGSADLTGEGLAMFLQAGLPMVNCEIQEHDLSQYTPQAIRNTVYAMGVQCTSWPWAYNAEDDLFFREAAENGASGQGPFMRATLREIYEGRGSEHGGLYADTTDMSRVERFWRRSKEDEYRTLGYEMKDREEVVPHFWACGMMPRDLSDTCETSIAGLFFAGEAPYVFSGGSTNACVGTGWMAGGGAAATKDGNLPAVVWSDVDAALAAAYIPLEREGDGLRPGEIMRKVQEAFWDGLGLIRDEGSIQRAIDELERIKAEDLPRMMCIDKSNAMNADWRVSMEVPGMLDDCLACGYASQQRTCSRGVSFVRSDYPELGEELYNTVTTYADGVWSVETQPVHDTYQNAKDILASETRVSFARGLES